MRGFINDCLRRVIGYSVGSLGFLLTGALQIRIRWLSRNQHRLKRKYNIAADTPVLAYGPEMEQLIQTAASAAGSRARSATTSGSTGHPKRILYTTRRLRSAKLTYTDVFVRACWAFGIKHTSLYVFGSFTKDASLTSMLLAEKKLPDYVSTLQAPYRVQHTPAIRALAAKYGPTAVRLWILSIANPGILYSTTPSTIATFLDELDTKWLHSSRLIKDWCETPEGFDPAIRRIARRLESRGSTARLLRIAGSNAPLPLELCAPAVEAYSCWTGGYVQPFLNRLAKKLASPRYRLIPMYSMSTETLETVTHFRGNTVSFLPLASRVLYEFIEETSPDRPENLLSVNQLLPGKTYTMVVTDPYGLRRYQTGDLFLCNGKVNGLPDLTFVRRRGLEYSFTGEKLTAEHVSEMFQRLRAQDPALVAGKFLTCVPSWPSSDAIPHYKILLIGNEDKYVEVAPNELTARCDQLLGEMNCEYKSKRAAGRLGPVRCVQVSTRDFAERIRENLSWETQFKFLPLYRQTWEQLAEINIPAHESSLIWQYAALSHKNTGDRMANRLVRLLFFTNPPGGSKSKPAFNRKPP